MLSSTESNGSTGVSESRRDILNFDRSALTQILSEELSLPPFRSRQLIRWIYKQRLTDFSAMTDIAQNVRSLLNENFRISRPKLHTVQQSKDGTRKYLFELPDSKLIESVLIKQATRYTLCVSSQVGCAIGCSFCRTGLMGLTRNLQTSEIVSQVLAVQDDVAERGADSFNNIVFMGMGEPFHNIDNVIRAVTLLNDPLGFDFSARKITVSTSGLVPAIEKFAASEAQANLAISLNATTNEQRDVLIPINRKWPIEKLLETLRAYPLKPGRRITIEYVMLKGVNDQQADLKRLPKLLHGIPSKINLIPYNMNSDLGYHAPEKDNVYRWQQSLLDAGLNSTIRWSKGLDIDAACGQLATASTKKKKSREKAATE